MAYDSANLHTVGAQSGGGPKLLVYGSTADAKAAIGAVDYFLTSQDLLNVNDIILAVGSDGLDIRIVTVSSSTSVDTGPTTLAVA